MRKLAAFTVSFALGICLAQYLLPERLLLPVAAVFFAAACLALLLPGLWRKRVLLVGTARSAPGDGGGDRGDRPL